MLYVDGESLCTHSGVQYESSKHTDPGEKSPGFFSTFVDSILTMCYNISNNVDMYAHLEKALENGQK